ncbi:MAG: Bax inhibitor-1 family protein, partial [Pseudomonadota bacterium]
MSETKRTYDSQGTTLSGVAFDEGLRKYMLGVYNYMAMGIAATALIAFFFVTNQAALEFAVGLRFIPFIALLAIGLLGPRLMMSGSLGVAHGVYWAYVALWGLLIGPMVALFVGGGLANEVYKAFFITASVFASMSLYGYT